MAGNFHIINLGCKVNKVEADSMAAQLLDAGAEQSILADADVVLINTCTVTGEADAKSRKALRRAVRQARGAVVIVCGCGAVHDPEQFKAKDGLFLVIANKVDALVKASELLGVQVNAEGAPVSARIGETFNTRVALKVQDGCDHACSYCIVPKVRGATRSVQHDQVLKEAKVYVDAGVREVVLTGIDLGSYQNNSSNLCTLLTDLLSLGSTFRIRLSSLELPSITNELIELIATSRGRICAHLHIPLQSGSDAVLSAMNRRYSVAEYLVAITRMQEMLPHLSLTTDVIVGFPGETEEDFLQTMNVCEQVGFSRIHIFRYSKRPGTPAAEMPAHIAPEELVGRAKRLHELAEKLTQKDALKRVGTTEAVLLESEGRGRTESYHTAYVPYGTERGDLVTMELTGYERSGLVAREC